VCFVQGSDTFYSYLLFVCILVLSSFFFFFFLSFFPPSSPNECQDDTTKLGYINGYLIYRIDRTYDIPSTNTTVTYLSQNVYKGTTNIHIYYILSLFYSSTPNFSDLNFLCLYYGFFSFNFFFFFFFCESFL
jgi:hypothetical protein